MKYSPLFIILFFSFDLRSQNLVPNGGFEKHTNYISHDTLVNLRSVKLIDWRHFGLENSLGINGNYNYHLIGHYRNKIFLPELRDVRPYSGSSCAIFEWFESCSSPYGQGCASYLISKLIKPMDIGKVYEVNYRIYLPLYDLADTTAINHIGFHLSLDNVNYTSYNIIPLQFFAHKKTEYNKWIEVKTRIQPLCPLRYIVFGMFKTTNFPVNTRLNIFMPYSYFIDDVNIKEVIPDSTNKATLYCKDTNSKTLISKVVSEKRDSLYFKNDDTILSKVSKDQLSVFVNEVPSYSLIYVKGYASSNGSLSHNLQLASQRARSTREYLIHNLGVNEERIITYNMDSIEWAEKVSKNKETDWKMTELTSPPFDSIMTCYNLGLKYLRENNLTLSDKYFSRWINSVSIDKLIYLIFDPRIKMMNNKCLIPVLSKKIENRYKRVYKNSNCFFIDSIGLADQYYRSIDMDLNFGLGYVRYYDQKILNELNVSDSIVLQRDKIHLKLALNFLRKNAFPTISTYGKRMVNNFINIINHSLDTTIYKNYLPVIYNNCMKGESEWQSYVTLYDRDLMLKGRKQEYGTQYIIKAGNDELYPVDSMNLVNERRKKLGLNPIN